MSKMVLLLTIALVASSAAAASLPAWQYRSDCFKNKPVSGLLQYVPGAGIEKFKPFATVEKDGFSGIDCVKDYMYNHGDKFGDNKHDYKLETVSNVSIVHYDAHVKKEDRAPMTHDRCFEFCRTVPNMGFFGLMNGRNCYCAPYYKQMAGDSSQCDAVCPGDNTMMCGGPSKSSIFSMHNCDSTEADLKDAGQKADALSKSMDKNVAKAKGLSADLQKDAAALQKMFGAVGDSAAGNLMQSAKVAAGKLAEAAKGVEPISKELKGHSGDAKKIKDFKDATQVTEAERILERVDATVKKGNMANLALEYLIGLSSPSSKKAERSELYIADVCAEKEGDTCKCDGDVYFAKKFAEGKPGKGDLASLDSMVSAGFYNKKTVFGEVKCSVDKLGPDPAAGFLKHCFCVKKANPEGSANHYMNLMHFVDKKYASMPSTCSGKQVGGPITGEDVDGCASACNDKHQECVGFQFFAEEKLCFLVSRFDSATAYTGCKSFLQRPSFLQTSGDKATICAKKEGDTCTCDGDVYYAQKFLKGKPGAGDIAPLDHVKVEGTYNKKTIFGSIKCDLDNLGPDPAKDFFKHCYCEKKAKEACYAKLSRFEGTTLKPDGSGKCKQCLKKFTKADRCWK